MFVSSVSKRDDFAETGLVDESLVLALPEVLLVLFGQRSLAKGALHKNQISHAEGLY
jgi:hypothetical protein